MNLIFLDELLWWEIKAAPVRTAFSCLVVYGLLELTAQLIDKLLSLRFLQE